MRVLLVYPPFCTPTVPPHSITCLASYIEKNSKIKVRCLDLNAKWHRRAFADLYERLPKVDGDKAYAQLLEKYASRAKKAHRENNVKMSAGAEPDLFGEMLELIEGEKPDVVGFSLVYNSQTFYALKLAERLAKAGVVCVAGGPAASGAVGRKMDVLKDGAELLRFLGAKGKLKDAYEMDYGQYPVGDYLSREMIYPMRSSRGCDWGRCAFCTHHENAPYKEVDMADIARAVGRNAMRNLFFIDDNISSGRLSELAEMLKPLKVRWWCQTRPTRDLLGRFGKLAEGGCAAISFGVESGSQRVLDSMRKGTRVTDVEKVLAESHDAGIRNLAFVMFGFPGEDEAAFMETMEFLRRARDDIDIASVSTFGLQRGSRVYDNPDSFGVVRVSEHGAPLGEIIRYEVKKGLDEAQVRRMKERFEKELRDMNRLPKIVCLLKEQSLLFRGCG